MRGTSRVAIAIFAVTGAALLAACGSSSGSGSSTAPSSPSSPSGSSSGGSIASRGLVASDLPAGWNPVVQASASVSPTGSNKLDADLAQCEGVPDTSADAATTDTAVFVSGQMTAESDITPYKSQSDIDADKASLTSPKAQDCINQILLPAIAAGLPAGVTLNPGSTLTVTAGANGGPDDVVGKATGQLTVTGPKGTVTEFLDIYFVGAHQTEATLRFTGLGAQVPADVESTALTNVAQRVAKP